MLAVVEQCSPEGLALCALRNKFSVGDAVELTGPDLRPMAFPAPLLLDAQGYPLREARHPEMKFYMQLPAYAPPLSFLRACRKHS